jgi:hypothetical protein
MKIGRVALTLTLSLLSAGRAFAQMETVAPRTVEVTLLSGGGTFVAAKNAAPSFGNVGVDGSVTYNMTRWVGIEEEVGATLGVVVNLVP